MGEEIHEGDFDFSLLEKLGSIFDKDSIFLQDAEDRKKEKEAAADPHDISQEAQRVHELSIPGDSQQIEDWVMVCEEKGEVT